MGTRKQISVTFDSEPDLYNELKLKAKMERMGPGEYIKYCVKKELYKDVNIENQQLGTLEQIKKSIAEIKNSYDLSDSLFLYYLTWFFAVNGNVINNWKDPKNPNDSKATKVFRDNILKEGERRRDLFMEFFNKSELHKVKLEAAILGNYIENNLD